MKQTKENIINIEHLSKTFVVDKQPMQVLKDYYNGSVVKTKI